MILVIQTNIVGHLSVWLINGRGQIITSLQRRIKWHGSEQLLRLINQLIGRRWPRVKKIIVVRGPGPFTAVRTGLVVANTLAWLRSIPVIGVVYDYKLTIKDFPILTKLKLHRSKNIIYPWYGKEPNITKAKSK